MAVTGILLRKYVFLLLPNLHNWHSNGSQGVFYFAMILWTIPWSWTLDFSFFNINSNVEIKEQKHFSFPSLPSSRKNVRPKLWPWGVQTFLQNQSPPCRGFPTKSASLSTEWMKSTSVLFWSWCHPKKNRSSRIMPCSACPWLLASRYGFCLKCLFLCIWGTLACHWPGTDVALTCSQFFLSYLLPRPNLQSLGMRTNHALHCHWIWMHVWVAWGWRQFPIYPFISSISPGLSPGRCSVSSGGKEGGRRRGREEKRTHLFSPAHHPTSILGTDSFAKHKS